MTANNTTDIPTIAELGEQGVLDLILPILESGNPALGPGDDAGALKVAGGEVLVSVDTLVQDQDFRTLWPSGCEHSAFDLGWKSIAQNVSDINAMGAEPTGAVISLSMPADTSVTWVSQFAEGVAAAVKGLGAQNMSIVGGDLGRSAEISVTTTVFGEAASGKVLRSTAQPAQQLALAGRVGMAAAGLDVLEDPRPAAAWSRSVRRLAQAQFRPMPPLESGPRAAAAGASAMLDLSDGLVRDASRLAKASGVDLVLDAQALQGFTHALRPAASYLGIDPMQWVLHGGEDFALLAAFPLGAQIPEEFTVIGEVKKQSGRRPGVFLNGKALGNHRGFDHFDKA